MWVWGVWAGALAWGQSLGDLEVLDDVLLEAGACTHAYMLMGVGAPSVAYDPDLERYLMVFEVQLSDPDESCPVGRWGLGMATSEDGVAWTAEPSPILEPREDSYYSCVAAHPSAVFHEGHGTLHVFFKAERAEGECDEFEAEEGGCSRYTGVGRARVSFDEEGRVTGPTRVLDEPVLALSEDMGFPRFVRQGGVNHLMFTKRPDVWMATSTDFSNFEIMEEPVLTADGSPSIWAEDELFNGALVCEDSLDFPLKAWVGGRNFEDETLTSGGMGVSLASSVLSWFLGTEPVVEWGDTGDWRHWDVLRVGVDDYLVYFSELDESGKPRIRLATTDPMWEDHEVYSKVCP